MKTGKLCSFVCTAAVAFGGIAAVMPAEQTVFAAEYVEKEIGDFTVHEYSTYIEITKYNNKTATELTVPNELDGLPVLSIAGNYVAYNVPFLSSQLESIVLPDTLISIGGYAFYNSQLKEISIPDSVKSIGANCFEECKQLEKAKLSNQLISIPERLFYNCTQLEKVEIPSSVTQINSLAFAGTAFTSVTIPENIKTIGDGAFYNCKSLESVELPSNIQQIGTANYYNGTFGECSALRSIHIPAGCTVVGKAFENCTALTSCTIDKGAKQSYLSFNNCKSLKSITIPASFQTCPSFVNCTSLEKVTLAEGITKIDSFEGCTSLKNIVLPETMQSFGLYGSTNCFKDCEKLEWVKIKNPKCKINDSAAVICNYTLNGISYFNGTIYGAEESTAHTYADKFHYTFVALENEPELLTGDFDGDNEITSEDAQNVLVAYVEGLTHGGVTGLTDAQFKACDINQDGEIAADDAQLILIYYTENTVSSKNVTWDDLRSNSN